MSMHRLAAPALGLALAALALPAVAQAPAAAAPARDASAASAATEVAGAASPSDIVRVRSRQIIDTLVARREQFRADTGALHAFVESELGQIFDREYSARLVLAQHARGAEPAAVDAFAEALTQHLMRRYGDALLEVDPGIEIAIKGETPLRGGAIVRVATEIEREGGAPVTIDYLFRDTEAGWKVFDVIVEGISYVQTYRNQFAEQLRGKTLAQVTGELRQGRIDVDVDD